MKVVISEDEEYPVYNIDEDPETVASYEKDDEWARSHVHEITPAFFRRYKRALRAYDQIQKELGDMVREKK